VITDLHFTKEDLMRRNTWFGVVIMGVLGGALLSAACASDPPSAPSASESNLNSQPSSGSKPAPSASASSTAPAASGSSAPGSTPGSPGDQACASKGDSCSDCCDQAHPGGVQTSDDAETACLCVPTRCATACAQSACNQADNAPDPVAGDACSTCMAKYENDDGTGECDKAVDAALQAKGGEAAALKACYDACP
jgi:hypothetical protein